MNSGQGRSDSAPPPRTVWLLIFACALVLASLASPFTYIVPVNREVKEKSFTVTFSVTYENRNSEGDAWYFTKDYRMTGLFVNDSWQTVYLTKVSYSIERFETDVDGNPIAFLDFPSTEIQPGENFSYDVAYRVVLKPRSVPEISEAESKTLGDIPQDLKSEYSGSLGPWLVGDPKLIDLAYEIAGNETKVLTIGRQFIVWLRDNIMYRTGDVPRYPNETLAWKTGDCDDQANLLITLCRIVGIPAYLQVGCIYIPNKPTETTRYWNGSLIINLTRIGWHGWAMVYVPPWGWLPVDLTYVSSSSLRADPLNAVKMSAIIAYPTVQYANITRTDYVADSRDQRDFLLSKGFRVLESDTMTEEMTEAATEGAIVGFPYLSVLLLIALMSACYSKILRIR